MDRRWLRRTFLMSQLLLVACEGPLLGEPQASATALECFVVIAPSELPSSSCSPENPIDVASFDPERDARVSIHIDEADGISSCDQLVADTSLNGESGATNGEQVTAQSDDDANECLVRNDPSDGVVFLGVEQISADVCAAGARFQLLDVAPPVGSLVCIEYVVALE